MKKFLGASLLALTMLTTPVLAENWSFVQDADDNAGGRVLIDIDSIKHLRYNDSERTYVEGTIKILGANVTPSDFLADVVIDYDSCVKSQNGNMFFTDSVSKKQQTFFWDQTASRVYDSVGAWMCGYARAAAGLIDKNGQPTAPPVPATERKSL